MQVHVYDMAEDTTAALCVQKVVRKAHLTRLAFNQHHPILIVGDDKCGSRFYKECLGYFRPQLSKLEVRFEGLLECVRVYSPTLIRRVQLNFEYTKAYQNWQAHSCRRWILGH